LVDLLITQAYRERASDIHIEPEEGRVLVRFRIDSQLQDVLTLDRYLLGRIITRIKVLSALPTDEHYSALDGKLQLTVDSSRLDVRVSIIPVADGEKAVLRLLSSRFRPLSLAELGMRPGDLKKVEAAISKSYGMVLSTGPTGSGKTTSIYSILKILNTREKNITTIEDPIEYRIAGVNQIQHNNKTNLSFANGLRAILRQDPNVIFVGEIRDSETAGVAVNAALTGHLVLSTLHTNDAATALPRLIDMKVEPFLVASTVNVIIAQRLVRHICPDCSTPVSLSHKELTQNLPTKIVTKMFGQTTVKLRHGKGCPTCHSTGYLGRIGIFEVMAVTEKLKTLITEKQDADTIRRAALSEGMTSMLEDGLIKVKEGQTTLEEVLRVTKVDAI
jgi:type II secretory ATPase GspE/PulE/Tfp pilus assembly ATPase PilB-like protein